MAADLAGRGSRLGASLIDTAALLVATIPLFIGAGSAQSGHGGITSMMTDPSLVPMFSPRTGESSGLMMLGFFLIGCVLLIQLIWLHSAGQTIGKKILRIRIVRAADGKNGGLVSNVLLRILAFNLIFILLYFVPVLGIMLGLTGIILIVIAFLPHFFSLMDILLIFSGDRRCIHDHIAGTQVIKG